MCSQTSEVMIIMGRSSKSLTHDRVILLILISLLYLAIPVQSLLLKPTSINVNNIIINNNNNNDNFYDRRRKSMIGIESSSELLKKIPAIQGGALFGGGKNRIADDKTDQFYVKGKDKVGVFLLNLGGPRFVCCVEKFLFNLFSDPDIIKLPRLLGWLQTPLALIISKARAGKVRKAYKSIGGGSPILRYTQAQADAIENKLKAKGVNAKCYISMRYWYPFTDEAVEQAKKDGITKLVVLPLYPHFSSSTTGSSLRELQKELDLDPGYWSKVKTTVIPSWYDSSGYIKVMGKLVRQTLKKFTKEELKDAHVLYSAHGVPKSYIAAGDPYKDHIEKCVQLIKKEYSPDVTTHLSFQSKVGPVEWLQPYTDDKLREMGQKGIKNLAVVPISFVSEHIETLEEIDMEYKELAEENGISNWKRVPAVNVDNDFTSNCAKLVYDSFTKPIISIIKAGELNNFKVK